MKRFATISALRSGAAPAALVLAMVPVSAYAQTAPGTPAAPAEAAATPDVVVTGSRIPQSVNVTSVAPVTVVSNEDLKLQGTTRVEDLLNSLPSVAGSQSSGIANGASGTATVDLRGLGASRTLTLINGRRLLPGDPGPGGGSAADINIIPAAMVKRVEVLTGGASSTYGADAVAGVVNFIMDTNFTGVRFDGQYSFYQHSNRDKFIRPLLDRRQAAGLAGYGYPDGSVADGGSFDGTMAIGSKFADDRGHVSAYFGYRKVNAVLQARRDYSACVLGNDGTGASICGGSGTSDNGNARVFVAGRPQGAVTHTFAPGGGFVRGASLYNFAPLNYYQRPDERFTAGVFANYEVSDGFKPYLEFMFMDDRTVAQIAPSGNFGNTLTINCDNPLMSPQQKAIICAPANLINGNLGGFPLAAGAGYNPNPGAAPVPFIDPTTGQTYNKAYFQLLRRNVEGGPRRSDLQHTNFRGVLGGRGDLGKAWSYDAYYQYGKTIYSQTYSNEFSVARLERALDVVNGSNGTPVCRSVLDGSDPNCVPYNVFGGEGAASAASVKYLSAVGFQRGQTIEQVASASFTGRLGEYGIKLPWAEDGVGVNVGVEYRNETLELQTDQAFQTGDLTGQGGTTLPIAGGFRVYEVFGEAQVPLAQRSFVYDLTLTGGYRYSAYKTTAGTSYNTDTFKVGLDFAPIRDIKFRGSYNRAVRAPNIQELFVTQTVQLSGNTDPCAGITISATDYGCLAQGMAIGQETPKNPAAQYNGLLGGVATLQPEKATTKSLGVVLQPGFLPRFALSVDWFDIKITDSIRGFGADAILADCKAKATATFTPATCGLVNRDPGGSLWLTPGGYVTNLPGNRGSQQVRGLEFNGSYIQPVGSAGNLTLTFNGTYLDAYKVNNGLTQPYDCAGLYGATCSGGSGGTNANAPLPRWRHKARLSWQLPSGVGLSAQWRYIGSVRAETTADNQTLASDENYNPGLRIGAQSYFDIAATATIGDGYSFRLGINNLLDRQPPLITSTGSLCPPGPCSGNTYPATYDALGRYIYAGFTLDF
ncbi:TonB-dependent receptor domain-containing protein [Sphingomonas lycopersici]|uniref:TonB-dependent receptor n=1 Tax=Sphingomonas lycopersici TaxID=2951807 RepID=A0AA42CQD0_9SPHN|nr:TonB-dependent receptor [Sphingomonas lycopersici]MCW6535565.1 TonB-dependent receptor [Sphingomonas lycopersici]